jgi:hypothetical protein
MKFNFTLTCFFYLSLLLFPLLSDAQRFSPSTILGPGLPDGNVNIGDYDNDGDADLLVTGREFNALTLRMFEVQNGEIIEQLNTGLPGRASGAYWMNHDSDSDLDVFLYTTDGNRTTASFYINNSGTFTEQVLSIPALSLARFSLVDYDLDGDVDIFMTGQQSNFSHVTYMLKRTATGFTTSSTSFASQFDGTSAWGDFDGDNDLDVVYSGYTTSTLYRNMGGDNFEVVTSTLPGSLRGTIQWADYDKDNDKDLLISGFTSQGAIAKILTNTNGNFSEYTGVTLAGTEQGRTQWIDYDADGDLDLYHSGMSSNGSISKLYELNAGSYTEVSNLGLGAPVANALGFFDYDKDTDLDALVLFDPNTARLYRNNLKSNPYSLDSRPGWPLGLIAHPLTNSSVELTWRNFAPGDADFWIEMRSGTSGSFSAIDVATGGTVGFISKSIGGLTPGVEYAFRVRAYGTGGYSRYSETIISKTASADLVKSQLSTIYIPYSSSWADADTDGDLDLFYSGMDDQTSNYAPKTIILKNTSGTLTSQAHTLPQLTGYDLDWSDFDHDGDLDLLIAGIPMGSSLASTRLLINTGNFMFTEYTGSQILGIRSGFARWLDVNSDGYSDIFLSGVIDGNNTVHRAQLLINQKNGTFSETLNTNLAALYQSDIAIADFNNDGKVDLVYGGFKDTTTHVLLTQTHVYENNGNNTFTHKQSLQGSVDGSIETADLDLDGDMDIVVGGNLDATLIYWNTNGYFSADETNQLPGFNTGKMTIGDIDNDGDPDLIMGGQNILQNTFSKIFLNDGAGKFSEGFYPLTKVFGGQSFILGDVDNDNDLDLFETAPDKAALFLNQKATANAKPAEPTILKAEGIAAGIKLIWQRGTDDKTPSKSLTSNIYVKSPDGKYLFNTHADVTTGKLKTPGYGNVFLNDSLILQDLEPGSYTVGVQNIDNSFAASAFTTETVTVSFVAPTLLSASDVCENSVATIQVAGKDVEWYKTEALTEPIGVGNQFQPTLKLSDSSFYVVQKSGSAKSDALKVTIKVYRKINGSIVREGSELVAPAGGASYAWLKDGVTIAGSVGNRISISGVATYNVKITNGPCETTTSYIVTPEKPEVSFASELCVGGVQTLTATGTNVKWYNKANTQIATGNTLTIENLSAADTITFATQTVNGIESSKHEARWDVHVYPQTAIAYDDGVLTASAATTYQWYRNDELIDGATQKTLNIVDEDGEYYAVLSNHGCSVTSESFLYTPIEALESQPGIYQRGPGGSVIIDAKNHIVDQITVFDYLGRPIIRIDHPEKSGSVYPLDVSALSNGLFIVRAKGSLYLQGKILVAR